ncbi:hypothetical protein CI610_03533 [invertebrate metagenome]|uniref:Peptidase A2 domain-containing protein n=1 Tax=invertebrate metagenome TaxID=1711999 RepID=A0A2H9T2T6_9ZZZZ
MGTLSDKQKGQILLDRMVGVSNEGTILIEGVELPALIDSGSMVTTISESGLCRLPGENQLLNLNELGLEVSVADGSPLGYLGYVECSVKLPFLSEVEFFVPILVVPDTKFNAKCPVIIGTNVIRQCKDLLTQEGCDVPPEWKLAVDSIQAKTFVVKTLGKKMVRLDPYESVVVQGRATGLDTSMGEVVTENLDTGLSYAVCPRVVKLGKNAHVARIPVKICNITAKPMIIKPGSNLCQIQEVKVVDSLGTDSPSQSRDTKTTKSVPEDLGATIATDNLSEDQLSRVRKTRLLIYAVLTRLSGTPILQ